ncbi:MAG: ComEC/Rec2 family competence protein [Candidatus Sungbacteria bacterium]|nr:ComEC/Rec2 family competence protein [Candidatus Sungbacteria bacterium]
MTKSRIFLLLLLFFIAGVAVRSLTALSYVLILYFSSGAGILLAIGVSQKNKIMLVLGFGAFLFVFGIFRFEQASQLLIQPENRERVVFRGIVSQDPVRKASVQELTVRIHERDGQLSAPFNALVTLRKYPEYTLGDDIIFSGELKKPENFDAFDYVSYLRGKSIVAVSGFPRAEKIDKEALPLARMYLSRIKHAFEEKIDLFFPEPHAALLKGLLLGERALLPEDFLNALKATGTTHIVALSGYNITLVGALMLRFLLKFAVPFRAAFWIACMLIALFVVMTGAAASVVRAGIMGVLVLVAQQEGRAYHMTNALVFAAMLMIVQNPYILRFDTGFQLSFLATCGILYLPSRIEPFAARVKYSVLQSIQKERRVLSREDRGSRWGEIFEKTFIETASAQIFVLPLLMYIFGSISLISIIANIAVLFAVPYAMGWGFAVTAIGFFADSFARAIAVVPWVLLSYIIHTVEWFSRVPYAAVSLYFFPWYACVFGYALIIFWIMRTRKDTIHFNGKNSQ